MLSQAVILLLSGILILVLAAVNVFLLWKSHNINKKIDEFLNNGKVKDFKDIEKKFDTAIQKIGVVRFNPFNDMGGNQSFVIAMLDGKNNGFVISSLFIKEGNRVYTKSVKHGKSEHKLSKEEIEAINSAINS